jgi:hypothetical protein
MPTLKWNVIYTDAPEQTALAEESQDRTKLVSRFNDAVVTGRVGRREVSGMWLDHETDGVVRVWGSVPREIALACERHLKRWPSH